MRPVKTFASVHLTVGVGHHLYREPDRPMDVELLREYLEPVEVYEKRPPRRRGIANCSRFGG